MRIIAKMVSLIMEGPELSGLFIQLARNQVPVDEKSTVGQGDSDSFKDFANP